MAIACFLETKNALSQGHFRFEMAMILLPFTGAVLHLNLGDVHEGEFGILLGIIFQVERRVEQDCPFVA